MLEKKHQIVLTIIKILKIHSADNFALNIRPIKSKIIRIEGQPEIQQILINKNNKFNQPGCLIDLDVLP